MMAETEAGLNRSGDPLLVVTRFLKVRRGTDSSESMTASMGGFADSTSMPSSAETSRDGSRDEDDETGLLTADPSS